MAPGYNHDNIIVRSWCDPNAGTCEGMRYQTADGRVWKEAWFPQRGTGVTVGEIIGSQIIETP